MALASTHPLGELGQDGHEADIEIRVHEDEVAVPADATWRSLTGCPGAWRAPDGRGGERLRLRYEDPPRWAEFVIGRCGATIDVYRSASADLDEVLELLVTQVLSCAMSERGLTCLHAGVVRVAGHVALIVGPRGAGKSTTTAAVARRGHEVLCDDVAAIESGPAGVTVRPGRSRVRLRPDAALALAGETPLTPVWRSADPGESKHHLEFERQTIDGPIAVTAAYVLARHEAPAAPVVTVFDPIDALAVLMANRHLPELGSASGRRRDFATLGDLVRAIPVRTLSRSDGLATLDAAVQALIADVQSYG